MSPCPFMGLAISLDPHSQGHESRADGVQSGGQFVCSSQDSASHFWPPSIALNAAGRAALHTPCSPPLLPSPAHPLEAWVQLREGT